MPPKGGGGVSKSAAAKAAKEAAKEAASAASAKAADDAYWKEAGDGAKSKSAAKKDEQARAKADAAKAKADAKREAEAAEAAELAKMNKANKGSVKRSASAGKVTQHQLAKAAAADKETADAEATARKMAARREVGQDDYAAALDTHDPTAHRELPGEGDVDARSLSEAVSALGLDSPGGAGEVDKHPERRAKAAYAAYMDRELPLLRQEKPGLKLQQYKDQLWRAWQKDPANPLVAAALARAAGGGG